MEIAPTATNSENGNTDQTLEYYFDVAQGELILGKIALESYLNSSTEESEVYELGDLIRNFDIEINRDVITPERNWAEAPKQVYLDFGHWLIKIAAIPDNSSSKRKQRKKITEDMIRRVNKLGLGPSVNQIMHNGQFGSLSRYYIELGENNTDRKFLFKDWGEQDCLDYLSQVTNELGHFPMLTELNELAKSDMQRPTSRNIKSILGYSYIEAAAKIGQKHRRSWAIRSNNELLKWGLDYMRANDGVVPTESMMRELLSQNSDDLNAPPHVSLTVARFKKFSNYQKLLRIAYDQQLSGKSNYIQTQFENDNSDHSLKTDNIEYSQSDIFHNALNIGIDFMHANDGQLPIEDDLNNLHKAGYLDILPEDIFSVFDDVSDFHSYLSSSFAEDVTESERYKASIMAEIDSQNGDLPPVLFKKVIKTHKSKTKTDSTSKRNLSSGIVTDEIVTDDEKIVRYSRFKLINYLLPNGKTTMDRKLSIAINFNLNTNKFSLASISGEICKIDSSLTLADVELAANELEIFDYIYPQIKSKYLKDLRIAAIGKK